MRVLDTKTGQFVEIEPEANDPRRQKMVYAILSHTWDRNGEQMYKQLKKIQRRYTSAPSPSQLPRNSPSQTVPPSTTLGHLTPHEVDALRAFVKAHGLPNPTPPPVSMSIWDDPELSPKIRDACRVARENGYDYIWIDSCCIDKSSSSELSEAINSMYKWYGLAELCYVYLADVPLGEDHHAKGSAFRESRWFCRGWTLQELIAPGSIQFLSKDWAFIGSKHTLVDLVESVTKIEDRALLHLEPLDAFSVAQRLSWAANRETTRVEDRAYSLLGIFDINMPTLYGEGNRAFRRLQEQIMQRTPDQSLFAWGDVYLSSPFFKDRDLTDTVKVHRATLCAQDWRRHLFATSPDDFRGCECVRTARGDTGQLLSSYDHTIAYTPTPYGISTQLRMVPLTHDLLQHTIPHRAEDFQLDTSDSPGGSQWYLAILRCELREHQGCCLGRVCYLTPSEESNVKFVYPGCMMLRQSQGKILLSGLDLFLLSSETIEHWHPQSKLKTVYIPHPDRTTLPVFSSLLHQTYTAIRLVLLRVTCDALRSRGYSADFYAPDQDHPTTHWLTLRKDQHTITAKFKHAFSLDSSERFNIKAEVKMSGSRVQLGSAPDSSEAECHTVTWWGSLQPPPPGWQTELYERRVRLNAAGDGKLTVYLKLDFGGQGYYFLHVDVIHDALPASSAVERVVDHEEGESTEEGSPSGATHTEDAQQRRQVAVIWRRLWRPKAR